MLVFYDSMTNKICLILSINLIQWTRSWDIELGYCEQWVNTVT